MNILTNGPDQEDINFCCVCGPKKAARLEPSVSTTVLTGLGKSGESRRPEGFNESVEVLSARRTGIDNLEETGTITRCNFVNNSDFLSDAPARADEYYR